MARTRAFYWYLPFPFFPEIRIFLEKLRKPNKERIRFWETMVEQNGQGVNP